MEDRQEAHPNLRRGGTKGTGRPRKEDRAAWAGINSRSRILISSILADMEAEYKAAKRENRRYRIDQDRLLKMAEVSGRYAGNEKDPGERVALISEETLRYALNKGYNTEQGVADAPATG